MTIELNSEQEQLMQDLLQGGGYTDVTDVLEEALRLLQQRDRLRAEIQAGLAELDRGEGIGGDEVFRELRARAAVFR